jgi:hypothetical protein
MTTELEQLRIENAELRDWQTRARSLILREFGYEHHEPWGERKPEDGCVVCDLLSEAEASK